MIASDGDELERILLLASATSLDTLAHLECEERDALVDVADEDEVLQRADGGRHHADVVKGDRQQTLVLLPALDEDLSAQSRSHRRTRTFWPIVCVT